MDTHRCNSSGEITGLNDKIIFFVICGAFLFIGLVFIPVWNKPQSTHATDVSNDLGYNLVNLGGNNSTGFNTNIPCSYLIFISGTAIQEKNCSTAKIDFSSTDASTTIQDSLNKITLTGGEIFIRQGTYTINHPINFTASGETLRGEGVTANFGALNYGTELFMGNNCNCNMFQYTTGDTILFPVITEMYLQGNNAHNTKGNATFFGGNNTGNPGQLVKDFELTQTYIDGFKQFGIVSNNAHDYKIQHNAIEHMGNTGIFIKTGDSIRIEDTLFRNSNSTIKAGAIQIGCNTIGGINPDNKCGNKFAKGAVIANNKIEVGGIVIENSATVIANNIFDQVPSAFTTIQMKYNDSNSIVVNNIMNGSGLGNHAVLIDNSTSNQVAIRGNQMFSYVNATISDSGTNTIIRNNVPTSINNDLVAGNGITITQGLKSNTIASNNYQWQLLCQTVLGSSNATISCDNFTATRNLIVNIYSVPNGGTGTSVAIRFNGDSGTNYAYRTSSNGAADGTAINQAQCGFDGTNPSGDSFYATLDINNNLSSLRKSFWYEDIHGTDTSSATAPARDEGVCKWSNTTQQITSITILANAGTGNFNTGSEITVWGYN